MLVRYIKLSAKKSKGKWNISSKIHDITQYVSNIEWGGSRNEVARKLSITIINAPNDPHIKGITLNLGSMLYLYDDNKKELFRGYIIERERGTNSTVHYTAYDLLYYTIKSNATYNFKNKTPEEITKAVCKDMKISTGSIAKTGKKYKLLMKDKSIYDIIMAGYTKAKKSTGTKYHVYTQKGKLCVGKMGDDWFTLILSDNSNITDVTYRESLADAVNRVVIYNDKGKKIKVVSDEASVVKYGIFQRTYTKEKDKDPTNSAKAMLKGITKTIELDCIGYTGCVTGKCVKILDGATGLIGKFYVDSDTHRWSNGVHTMHLGLTLTNAMDTKDSDN